MILNANQHWTFDIFNLLLMVFLQFSFFWVSQSDRLRLFSRHFWHATNILFSIPPQFHGLGWVVVMFSIDYDLYMKKKNSFLFQLSSVKYCGVSFHVREIYRFFSLARRWLCVCCCYSYDYTSCYWYKLTNNNWDMWFSSGLTYTRSSILFCFSFSLNSQHILQFHRNIFFLLLLL